MDHVYQLIQRLQELKLSAEIQHNNARNENRPLDVLLHRGRLQTYSDVLNIIKTEFQVK